MQIVQEYLFNALIESRQETEAMIGSDDSTVIQKIDELNAEAWKLRDEDVALARAKNNESLNLLQGCSYHRGMIQALTTNAFLELREAKHKEGLELALKAEKLSNEQVSVEFLPSIYNAVARGYGGLSVMGLAFQYLYKQLYIAEELYSSQNKAIEKSTLTYYLGSSKQDIAFGYMQMDSVEQAISMFKEAIELLSTIDDEWPRVLATRNLAECYLKSGDFEEAESLLLECKRFAEERSHDTAMRFTYDSLARLYEQKGDFRKSLEFIEKGKKSIKSQVLNNANYTVFRARILLKLKEYVEVEKLLKQGIASGEFSLRDLNSCYKLLEQCYSELGLFEKSREVLLNYVATSEKLQKEVRRRSIENNSQVQDLEKFRKEVQEAKYNNDVLEAKVNELDELQARYYQLSIVDPLTDIPNRRYITEYLENAFASAKRYGHGLGLALIDLDYFKSVNDDFSHQVGDDVLKAVAEILDNQSRKSDAIARFGGEEFILTFKENSVEDSVAFCERVRKAIKDYDWQTIAKGLKITASFGIASLETVPESKRFEDLISYADKKLYESKDKGRDCISY